jgi:hypothetical protein
VSRAAAPPLCDPRPLTPPSLPRHAIQISGECQFYDPIASPWYLPLASVIAALTSRSQSGRRLASFSIQVVNWPKAASCCSMGRLSMNSSAASNVFLTDPFRPCTKSMSGVFANLSAQFWSNASGICASAWTDPRNSSSAGRFSELYSGIRLRRRCQARASAACKAGTASSFSNLGALLKYEPSSGGSEERTDLNQTDVFLPSPP